MKNKIPYLAILSFGNLVFFAFLLLTLLLQFLFFPKAFAFLWGAQLVLGTIMTYANWRFYTKTNISFDDVLTDLKK